jgi:5-methylcytosine-specific restriction endonuclease McrA
MSVSVATFTDEMNYWNCDHSQTEIRWRVRRNGQGCWVMQCLVCGREMRPVAKSSPDVLRLTEKKPFDEALAGVVQSRLREARERQWKAQQQAAEQETEQQSREWWRQYNQYLKTPQWERKRHAVMKRSQGICEGCRVNKAVQVHHLTYEHVGDEFLWELVAVCRMCHSRIHPHMDN